MFCHIESTKLAENMEAFGKFGRVVYQTVSFTFICVYCADLSRTVTLGRPSDEIARLHAVVREAQEAARAAVAPGVDVREVDGAARRVIAAAGFGDHFVHGTGHGLGLDIHEPPLIGPSGDGRLQEFSTVTVEPGIYLPGVGGVRIEDTVLVTANGAEPLTTVPRVLIEC